MAKKLATSDFLLKFQAINDPWEKSRLVGMRISEIRKDFAKLSKQEKDELGRESEVEFKAGVELLSKDKQTLLQLISITDPPFTE